VASFALDGDIRGIQNHRLNFDHHTASIRRFVVWTLGLVGDRLEFGDAEILQRCETNLRVLHGGCELATVVALLGKGDPSSKAATLKSWLGPFRFNELPRTLLEALPAHGTIPSGEQGAEQHQHDQAERLASDAHSNFTFRSFIIA